MEAVKEYVPMHRKLVTVDVTKVKTVIEYAKMIGKTRQRVYQMINDGSLEVLRVAGKVYVIPKVE